MISVRHYCVAMLGAVLIHLAGLFLLSYSVSGGAVDKGEQGVEIDLGMLGDLRSATETQQSTAIEAPAIDPDELSKESITPQPSEQKVEEKIEQKVEHEVAQEVTPPVELKQSAEITVKKDPVKKDPIKQVEKIDSAKALPESAQPIAVKETQIKKEAKVIEQTIESLQAPTAKSAEATNTGEINQTNARKKSTGSGDALTSGGTPSYKRNYYALIAATLAKYKRYPKYARKQGQEGTVLLSFTVLSSGLVKDIKIKKSSGHSLLDRSVKKMLQQASPLPAFPAQQTARELNISIPIVFKLNQ
jgi:protein TonB